MKIEVFLSYQEKMNIIRATIGESLETLSYLMNGLDTESEIFKRYQSEFNSLQETYFFYTGKPYDCTPISASDRNE